jgi:hypothetical protein
MEHLYSNRHSRVGEHNEMVKRTKEREIESGREKMLPVEFMNIFLQLNVDLTRKNEILYFICRVVETASDS